MVSLDPGMYEGEPAPYGGFCCPVCQEPIRLRELIVDKGRQITARDMLAICDNCVAAWTFDQWRAIFPHRPYAGPLFGLYWGERPRS